MATFKHISSKNADYGAAEAYLTFEHDEFTMKDYYDLRYEETDGENQFVDETAYQEKQSEQSKMEDQLMEMVGGSESNVWKLYESIMCIYFDMEEIIKQAVYLQGAYDRERMLK